MPRYGTDFDRSRGFGGGMGRPGFGSRYFAGRGGSRYGSEFGGPPAGRGRGDAFRGRGGAYDTYFRRDFLTNQGDFSPEFGGGREYGYRGMGPRGGGFRGMETGPRRGGPTSYGPGYGDRWETIRPEDIPRRNFDRW